MCSLHWCLSANIRSAPLILDLCQAAFRDNKRADMVGFNDCEMRKGDRNRRWRPVFFSFFFFFSRFFFFHHEDAKTFIMKAFSRDALAVTPQAGKGDSFQSGLSDSSDVSERRRGARQSKGPLLFTPSDLSVVPGLSWRF